MVCQLAASNRKSADASHYHADADRIFYNRSTPFGTLVLMDRGNYVVVGPRQTTTLGLTDDITSNPNYIKRPIGAPSKQVISLPAPCPLKVMESQNTCDTNISQVKTPLSIVAAGGDSGTNRPPTFAAGSPAAANGIGISISEPLFSSGNYYPEPKVKGPAPDNITEWYGDWQMASPDTAHQRRIFSRYSIG